MAARRILPAGPGTCILRPGMAPQAGAGDCPEFPACAEPVRLRTGQALYLAGQRAEHIHVIRSGAVKLVRGDDGGHQRIVRILKEGDMAGLEALSGARFGQAAVAANDVEACRIPLAPFRAALEECRALRNAVMERALAAVQESELWLFLFSGGRHSSRCRVARLLLRLRIGDTAQIHRLTLDDMGAILGMAPETVSRAIADLARKGVVGQVGQGRGRRRFAVDLPALDAAAAGR